MVTTCTGTKSQEGGIEDPIVREDGNKGEEEDKGKSEENIQKKDSYKSKGSEVEFGNRDESGDWQGFGRIDTYTSTNRILSTRE